MVSYSSVSKLNLFDAGRCPSLHPGPDPVAGMLAVHPGNCGTNPSHGYKAYTLLLSMRNLHKRDVLHYGCDLQGERSHMLDYRALLGHGKSDRRRVDLAALLSIDFSPQNRTHSNFLSIEFSLQNRTHSFPLKAADFEVAPFLYIDSCGPWHGFSADCFSQVKALTADSLGRSSTVIISLSREMR